MAQDNTTIKLHVKELKDQRDVFKWEEVPQIIKDHITSYRDLTPFSGVSVMIVDAGVILSDLSCVHLLSFTSPGPELRLGGEEESCFLLTVLPRGHEPVIACLNSAIV